MSGKKPNPRKKAAKGPPKPLPSIFISKEAVATFWFVVAAGAFIVGGVYAERLVANSGRSPQFVGIGTPGSVARPIPETRTTLAPAAALELRESQTRLLMESIFNKSGRGLDAPERCEKLMSKEAWDYVNQHLIEPQKEAFAEGKIHQKVSIQDLKVTYRRSLRPAHPHRHSGPGDLQPGVVAAGERGVVLQPLLARLRTLPAALHVLRGSGETGVLHAEETDQ